jgi:carbonic anhydrase/acetyltransferase-like protein (isoleucine patch superfamily)
VLPIVVGSKTFLQDDAVTTLLGKVDSNIMLETSCVAAHKSSFHGISTII